MKTKADSGPFYDSYNYTKVYGTYREALAENPSADGFVSSSGHFVPKYAVEGLPNSRELALDEITRLSTALKEKEEQLALCYSTARGDIEDNESRPRCGNKNWSPAYEEVYKVRLEINVLKSLLTQARAHR